MADNVASWDDLLLQALLFNLNINLRALVHACDQSSATTNVTERKASQTVTETANAKKRIKSLNWQGKKEKLKSREMQH